MSAPVISAPNGDPARPRREATSRAASGGMLLAFLGISFAVAALGTVTTIASVNGWYSHAAHVAWTPPNWSFGVVWTVLYTAIAVSGWLVWRRRSASPVGPALLLFVVQLVLNSLWTPTFFGGFTIIGSTALWLALVDILLLDLFVAATMVLFWPVSKAATWLLVPYFVWILYATSLNLGDAALNALL